MSKQVSELQQNLIRLYQESLQEVYNANLHYYERAEENCLYSKCYLNAIIAKKDSIKNFITDYFDMTETELSKFLN